MQNIIFLLTPLFSLSLIHAVKPNIIPSLSAVRFMSSQAQHMKRATTTIDIEKSMINDREHLEQQKIKELKEKLETSKNTLRGELLFTGLLTLSSAAGLPVVKAGMFLLDASTYAPLSIAPFCTVASLCTIYGGCDMILSNGNNAKNKLPRLHECHKNVRTARDAVLAAELRSKSK